MNNNYCFYTDILLILKQSQLAHCLMKELESNIKRYVSILVKRHRCVYYEKSFIHLYLQKVSRAVEHMTTYDNLLKQCIVTGLTRSC